MEIWTRQRDQPDWTPQPDVPRGLAVLLDAPDVQVLLLCEAPDVERELLVAALRLVQALGGDGGAVVVASPHPSAELIETLAPYDVDQVWVVERRGARRTAIPKNASELGRNVCPHLRTETRDGTTLSVCGRRRDRLVLGRRNRERWCLTNNAGCPHRGPGRGDA
ncbi:MAG: hypothetical protein R6V85_07770 [Polyangia bacterium]